MVALELKYNIMKCVHTGVILMGCPCIESGGIGHLQERLFCKAAIFRVTFLELYIFPGIRSASAIPHLWEQLEMVVSKKVALSSQRGLLTFSGRGLLRIGRVEKTAHHFRFPCSSTSPSFIAFLFSLLSWHNTNLGLCLSHLLYIRIWEKLHGQKILPSLKPHGLEPPLK